MVSRALPSCTSNRFLAGLGPVSRTLFASPDGGLLPMAVSFAGRGPPLCGRWVAVRSTLAERDAYGVLPTLKIVTPSASSVRVRCCRSSDSLPVCTAATGRERLRHESLENAHTACTGPSPSLIRDGVRSPSGLVQTPTSETAGAPRTTTPPAALHRDDLRAPQARILVTRPRHYACGSRAESSLRYAPGLTSSTTRTCRDALRAHRSP